MKIKSLLLAIVMWISGFVVETLCRAEESRTGTNFGRVDEYWKLSPSSLDPAKLVPQNILIQTCKSCHGTNGISTLKDGTPHLAGLSASYITKQLVDFRSARRKHEAMEAYARNLSDLDILRLAEYFANVSDRKIARQKLDSTSGRARQLDQTGDQQLAVPACANCHGPNGEGLGYFIPLLAGQPNQYLLGQLRAFRIEKRQNDDHLVMRAIAKRLSEDDLKILADYFAQ